jgi:hypothetical protein|tara:strand:- start:2701 stop:2919 length:219 start_codon:yes stop_codon:yes gene_type:complete
MKTEQKKLYEHFVRLSKWPSKQFLYPNGTAVKVNDYVRERARINAQNILDVYPDFAEKPAPAHKEAPKQKVK